MGLNMKLGVELGYSGAHMALPMDIIKRAEQLGFRFRLDRRKLWFGRF